MRASKPDGRWLAAVRAHGTPPARAAPDLEAAAAGHVAHGGPCPRAPRRCRARWRARAPRPHGGRTGVAAAPSGVEDPRQILLGDAAAAVRDGEHPTPSVVAGRATATVPSAGVRRIALTSRLPSTRAHLLAVDLDRERLRPGRRPAVRRAPRASGSAPASASPTRSCEGDPVRATARAHRRGCGTVRRGRRPCRSAARPRCGSGGVAGGSAAMPSSRASDIARSPASGVRRSCEIQATSSRREVSRARSRPVDGEPAAGGGKFTAERGHRRAASRARWRPAVGGGGRPSPKERAARVSAWLRAATQRPRSSAVASETTAASRDDGRDGRPGRAATGTSPGRARACRRACGVRRRRRPRETGGGAARTAQRRGRSAGTGGAEEGEEAMPEVAGHGRAAYRRERCPGATLCAVAEPPPRVQAVADAPHRAGSGGGAGSSSILPAQPADMDRDGRQVAEAPSPTPAASAPRGRTPGRGGPGRRREGRTPLWSGRVPSRGRRGGPRVEGQPRAPAAAADGPAGGCRRGPGAARTRPAGPARAG